jgi:hypothetical protein
MSVRHCPASLTVSGQLGGASNAESDADQSLRSRSRGKPLLSTRAAERRRCHRNFAPTPGTRNREGPRIRLSLGVARPRRQRLTKNQEGGAPATCTASHVCAPRAEALLGSANTRERDLAAAFVWLPNVPALTCGRKRSRMRPRCRSNGRAAGANRICREGLTERRHARQVSRHVRQCSPR